MFMTVIVMMMAVIVAVIVPVCAAVRMMVMCAATFAVRMGMSVLMPMMFVEYLLSDCMVFVERSVVPVPMTAAVSTSFGLKRQRRGFDPRAEPCQHRFEHGIGFQLQIIGTDLDGRMAIAEMISSTRERQRVARSHNEHGFIRGDDAHEAAVLGNEHVAVRKHGAARQHERNGFTVVERCGEPAFAARFIGERERRRAHDERSGEFHVWSDTFVDRAHGGIFRTQNKK
jgi:hypothetical protein